MTSPLQQKLKITGPVVITANRVGDGAVVYRTADGRWTTRLEQAAVATTAPVASALLAECGRRRVSARSAPISRRCGSIATAASHPGNLREQIRAARPDHRPAGRLRTLSQDPSMYAYDELDRTLVNERVAEFRDQVRRRLSGELTEDEFKPLRLMNGVYLQLHAYMLRVAIPYGTLSSEQLRALAHVARRYDRGYGHFTTRQNIQFNWIKLEDLPDALADLAGSACTPCRPRQLHPQRHHRPMGRRRARRGRGSAHLGGDPAPVLDAASGILVPAAQVQDRDHRVRARPRRDQGARHRPAAAHERAPARPASR